MHPKTEDLTNREFEYYTVEGPTSGRLGNAILWRCRCVCGAVRYVTASNLKRRSGSCGCKKGERVSRRKTRHGMTGKRVWRIWKGMIERCHKPYGKDYDRYGGAGISACPRWRGKTGFENFLADMGDPGEDSDLTLDRKDGTKGYSPTNCRWRTQTQQHRNRKDNRLLTVNGQTRTLAEWAERTGKSRHVIAKRLDVGGWKVHSAIFVPVRSRK